MGGYVNLRILICVAIASALALLSHIYISTWAKPLVARIMEGTHPDLANYPAFIYVAAYVTAFIQVGLLAFIYYHVGHFLLIKNRFIKALILAVIILAIKGEIRQSIMDFIYSKSIGIQSPLLLVTLSQIDQWVANLLLTFCLVYLCPSRNAA